MTIVSLFDAKTHFSRLVEELVQGRNDAVVVSRHGKPVVQITALPSSQGSKRIGVAKGKLKAPDHLNACDDEIIELFQPGGKRK